MKPDTRYSAHPYAPGIWAAIYDYKPAQCSVSETVIESLHCSSSGWVGTPNDKPPTITATTAKIAITSTSVHRR